jgi:hypothetical protein
MQSLPKVLPSQPQTTSFGPVICGQNLGFRAQVPPMSAMKHCPGLC